MKRLLRPSFDIKYCFVEKRYSGQIRSYCNTIINISVVFSGKIWAIYFQRQVQGILLLTPKSSVVFSVWRRQRFHNTAF